MANLGIIKNLRGLHLFLISSLYAEQTHDLWGSSMKPVNLSASLTSLTRFLIDRVIPHHCPICYREMTQAGLCHICWHSLTFVSEPICESCGRHLASSGPVRLCGACLHHPPLLHQIRAPLYYDGAGRDIILQVKYADRLDLIPVIARLMQELATPLITNCDVVMPIPLHLLRRLSRRYNQSAEIARCLCRQAGASQKFMAGHLYRQHHTASLGRFGLAKRKRILRRAFAVRQETQPLIAGKHILLIDDVMTTGTTMTSAARTLRKAGAARVSGLCFLRVR